MPLAGYLASRGDMSVTGAILGGTLGSVAGTLVLYGVVSCSAGGACSSSPIATAAG